MNGKYYIGKKVSSFEAYHPEDPITGVRLTVDQSNAYFAGDMDGNVWEMHCPYGTQQMADNILASLRGQVYKGFEAQDAVLSPEAELGDGITVNGLYTSLGYRKVEFGPGHFSTVSAPGNNEPDEEYKYLGQKDRDEQYKRADTYSYIEKTSEEIKLGVRNDMDKQSAEFTVQLGKIEASLQDEINDLSADVTLKYDEFSVSLKNGLDGLSADFQVKLDGLSASFEDSQKQQTANFEAGLSGLKYDLEDQLSKQSVSFEADLNGIRTRVTDAEGDISSLEQTAKSLRSDLTDAEGNISSLEQTATSLRSDITSAQGNISSLQQTATSITHMVTSTSGTVGDDLVEFARIFHVNDPTGGTDRHTDAWFYPGVPSTSRFPASGWSNSSTRQAHNKDLYLDTNSGKMYTYVYQSGTGNWYDSSDVFDYVTAMKKASKSNDTRTDYLRRVFMSTPTTPYSVGDLWYASDSMVYRCNTDRPVGNYSSADWEDAKNYMDVGYFSESKIEQIASGITLSVNNGITGSSISLTAGKTTVTSPEIAFSGVVTFINSGYNTTTINGGKITAYSISSTQIASNAITADKIQAGTITADKLAANAIVASSIKGSIVGLIDDYGSSVGSMSITNTTGGYGIQISSNSGIRMQCTNYNSFFWVNSYGGNFGTTYAGFQITANCVPTSSNSYSLGTGGNLWSAVYAATGAIQSSDERYKNGIDAIPDKYVAMLDHVEPVIYKLNDGTSGRYHAGFISQQVKEAMDATGVDSTEFGGFVIAKDEEGNDFYMLRYEEFIAPMLAKMRQLEQRIKILEGA